MGQRNIDMVVPHARAADEHDHVRGFRDRGIGRVLVPHEPRLGEGFVAAFISFLQWSIQSYYGLEVEQ